MRLTVKDLGSFRNPSVWNRDELILYISVFTHVYTHTQEKDVRYLVDVVWGAQSALGACRDLHDLVMVRWDRLLEWSPWNCILLTKDEASAHLRVNDVHEVCFAHI